MNRIVLAVTGILLTISGFAQTDTTNNDQGDTIHVGNFVIIKKNKGKSGNDTFYNRDNINLGSNYYRRRHRSNISTNWFIFDLGFANWRDKTDYAAAAGNSYLQAAPGAPSFSSNDFSLRNSKSSNVNIWIFMQKLNLYRHIINLKYGLGLEMYNYRYETNISYHKDPAYIFRDTISFSKNKLAADYATIPFMININPMPDRRRGLSFSVGMTAGYLYASRNKQISSERGKQKVKGDIGLEKWRTAYVAEVGLGPVRIYGSYSMNALHEQALKQYPYVIGMRFSNW